MNNYQKKCSFKEHKEIDVIFFCLECKMYMCNKCSNYHNICENHHQYNLAQDINEIFIDICDEANHPNKLQNFCKDHNKLVWASFITKLGGEGNGQYKDCSICFIKDIKEVKKSKLKESILF